MRGQLPEIPVVVVSVLKTQYHQRAWTGASGSFLRAAGCVVTGGRAALLGEEWLPEGVDTSAESFSDEEAPSVRAIAQRHSSSASCRC